MSAVDAGEAVTPGAPLGGSAPARPHPHLDVSDSGGIRTIRIDREEKLGALSGSLVAALGAEAERLRGDRSIRVVILTGTGRGFIAGADIAEYALSDVEEFTAYQRRSRAVFGAFEQLPQATIAAVNGFALGGGFELALCCDLILASEEARFALPEIRLGLIPGGGGTQRLARAAGTRWTKELVMTGRTVLPEEALARGLLTRVVPAGELAAAARELAEVIARRAPLAVREAKRVIDDGVLQEVSAALTAEQAALARLFETRDGREGIDAFLAKRPARFEGR